MTIYIVRASHANEYELQNYSPLTSDLDIKVITSYQPLTHIAIPTIPLWSPTDLPSLPFRRQLLNRLIGGEQWLIGLEKMVKDNDIVHTAETYTPYTHQAVELRKKGKIKKLICTCWETIPYNNEKFAKLREWKTDAYQYVDLFHTPTERAKQALVREGVSSRKIKVIPYGIDLSRFYPNRKRKNKKPVVLTVARKVSDKGIDIFAKIANQLQDKANFQWVRTQAYNGMPSVYQHADIFFLPSRMSNTWEEQYGMVLIEAMASGLPIVTTTSGAIPEVVGDAALLADPIDIDHLTASLTHLISSQSQRLSLGLIGRRRAEAKYDNRLVAKQLSTLYTKVTAL
jgi:alpha-maltose-1-phosphate synthase